jgi:hypothetical protein
MGQFGSLVAQAARKSRPGMIRLDLKQRLPVIKMARAWRVLPALLIALTAASAALAGLPKVPDDFEVRLVANVPAFLYACQVATAPDGALYVAVDPMDQVGPYEANLGKIYV